MMPGDVGEGETMAEIRIRICDDDPALLELRLRRLDRMGFKPDRAEDSAAAQALIKENSDARFAADAGVEAEAWYAHVVALRYKEPGTSLGPEE